VKEAKEALNNFNNGREQTMISVAGYIVHSFDTLSNRKCVPNNVKYDE